jgi:hypothetical protein
MIFKLFRAESSGVKGGRRSKNFGFTYSHPMIKKYLFTFLPPFWSKMLDLALI